MHKSDRCFKLELEWPVFGYKLPLKSEKVIQKRKKSCSKSEKLLEGLKVAPNLKSCSKVAEQLMHSPTEVTGKNTKAGARERTRNYNFECDWLI